MLRERDAHIASLEAEFHAIQSKLSILQSEKSKLLDNEAVMFSIINDNITSYDLGLQV